MNKNKRAKDNKRNNIFAAAFDYLKRNTNIKTQQELANRMGVTADTISRIIRAKTDVTEDAITKLQTASGCIFNLQWLRGESETMMANDIDKEAAPAANNRHDSTQFPDYSSMTNAMIAAKDDAIESLKRELVKTEESAMRELAAKDDTISALRGLLDSKDALIDNLKQQISDLHYIIEQQKKDFIGNYPFTVGAADEGTRQQAKK